MVGPTEKPCEGGATLAGGDDGPLARPCAEIYRAFVADRVHGFDASAALPRGRRVRLPITDSIEDTPVDLEAVVGDRRCLLVFYPGGWCTGSMRALAAFQAALDRFAALDTVVVALTPELPRLARATAQRTGAAFPVASDHALVFSRSLGLVYKLPVPLRRLVRDAGVRLGSWNGEGSFDLPMPAALLLDRRRRVRWHEVPFSAAALRPEAALAALAQLPSGD